jgi:hypothetical protein
MNSIFTFAERLLFAITCVLGWVIFPMFILGAGITLFAYALLAEIVAQIAGAAAPVPSDKLSASTVADRLSGSLRP